MKIDAVLKALPPNEQKTSIALAALARRHTSMEKSTESSNESKIHERGQKQFEGMVDGITTYMAALDEVLRDPDVKSAGNRMTINQAVRAKQCGLRLKDCKFDVYSDSKLDARSSRDGFGKGNCNTVDKLVYEGEAPGHIFKPLKPAGNGNKFRAAPDGNCNLGARLVAEAFGLDVIPKACFTQHGKNVGVLMDIAPGEQVARINRVKGRWEPKKPWQTPPTPELLASLHGQLNGLEWCDMLAAQKDRHAENYLLQIDGNTAKVTGIDNDLTFAAEDTGLVKRSYNAVGTPKLIDATIYDRLMKMDLEKDVLPGMKGLLDAAQIDALRKRLIALKDAAKELDPDYVVKDWKTWTTRDGRLNASQETGSLFARDIAQFCREDGIL